MEQWDGAEVWNREDPVFFFKLGDCRKIKKLQTLRRPLSMVGRERVERVGVGMEECSNPTPSEV